MKVIISVSGKFHAFELAKCLHRNGALDRIITSYPYFKLSHEDIPKEKIVSLPFIEMVKKICAYLPFMNAILQLDKYLSVIFDTQASRYIRASDIFVGWSGSSLQGIRKAKSQGIITVVERGSPHIEFQRDILKEEYELWGIRGILPSPFIVEKELKEYQEADYISIPSLFAKQTFLDKGIPENKLICIPYGVDMDLFRPVGKEDTRFRIIYAGAMILRKGVHYLLKAVSELRLKNCELWLMGRVFNEFKPLFKKYRDSFQYLGQIDYGQLYKYYSQGSVFVLPSIEEGMACVLLQAMACGLPVICTDHTGGPDIIRDGQDGFIVPIRNVEALKEKIVYLYENQNRLKEMGISARGRVAQYFTWKQYAAKVLNSYGKCMNR